MESSFGFAGQRCRRSGLGQEWSTGRERLEKISEVVRAESVGRRNGERECVSLRPCHISTVLTLSSFGVYMFAGSEIYEIQSERALLHKMRDCVSPLEPPFFKPNTYAVEQVVLLTSTSICTAATTAYCYYSYYFFENPYQSPLFSPPFSLPLSPVSSPPLSPLRLFFPAMASGLQDSPKGSS